MNKKVEVQLDDGKKARRAYSVFADSPRASRKGSLGLFRQARVSVPRLPRVVLIVVAEVAIMRTLERSWKILEFH